MSGCAISSAMFAGFTEPPYWMRTAVGRRLVGQLGDLARMPPHIAWASSAVAVRPVPIAQIGS